MAITRPRPHVNGVKDWNAQQSLSLLWDRVFAIQELCTDLQAAVGDLVNQVARQDDALTRIERKADEALAIAQRTAVETAESAPPPGDGTMPDYAAIVAAVLVDHFVSPIVANADVEAAKAQFTRRAAWELYSVNPPDTNMRLLSKSYGTAVNGRSTDIIVQGTDGSFADCCGETDNGDGTSTIHASWSNRVGDSNTTDSSRWIVPTGTIAAESGPMTMI